MSAQSAAPAADALTDNLPALLDDRNRSAEERVAKSGFRDPVAYALGAFARSDGGGGASFADPGAGLKSFDPKTAVARFVITTDAKDRAGDVVVPHGCKGRLGRYEKNPVVFFGHKSYGLPVGSAVDADGVVALEFSENAVVSPVRFHLKTAESEQVAALVEARELRSASIGFLPLRAVVHRKRADEEDEGRPKNEVTFEPYHCYRFVEWELYEWSVVAVPMNAECVACRLSKGIGGKPLSDGVRRYLEPFAAPARVWAPGASLAAAPLAEAREAAGKTRGRKAVAEAVRGQADVVRALAERVDSLAGLVEGVASSVRALADRPQPSIVPVSPADVDVGRPAPAESAPDSVPDPVLNDVLASLALVRERQEANAAELRRITGRVD